MCAALAEIDPEDTRMNAEAQHLLRLASRLPLDQRLQDAHRAAGVGRLK
jgi:hypothetical protein